MKNVMTRPFLSSLILILFIPGFCFGQDSTRRERAVAVVPLITSSPLMGFGVGLATSYVYTTGPGNSSKSQLQVGGQYSTTHSYSAFVRNNAWFKDNGILSTTTILYSGINNEFESEGKDVAYNINSFLIKEQLMFRIARSVYIGGPIGYKDVRYKENNEAGKDFIEKNGIRDEQTGAFGVAASYDTRKNKYYPSTAAWISLGLNANPVWLGSLDPYYSLVVDARYYAKGFGSDDVWAWHYYGQYSSELTPDGGLPTLSGKSQLRGFPAGQFKARFQSGVQTEYRYTLGDTRFRFTGFFGVANLTGGSVGLEGNSRQDDGWYSAGGVGVRYRLQPVTGVDLRLDLVRTSEGANSVYLMLNQAF
jgi:outer membrane protein assembly factor BamA